MNILSLLYKEKGETKDPNNWRPICLKETSAKIVSTIIAKRRLKHMNLIGAHTQFGQNGCQEALNTLRNILMTKRQHGKEFIVLFVDLVKAFANVNLYSQRAKKQQIGYTNGVFQGDNASPVLFLFLIMAATDSFRSVFILEDKPMLHYFPDHEDPDKQNGRLKGQSKKPKAKPFRLTKPSLC